MYRENLREHWPSQLAHVAVGMVAGILLTRGYPWAGLALMGTVWTRQGLEFAKRKDTPGIDLLYHIVGLLAGIGIGLSSIEREDLEEFVDEIRERYKNRPR